jgi:Asparaginase, N-terminal
MVDTYTAVDGFVILTGTDTMACKCHDYHYCSIVFLHPPKRTTTHSHFVVVLFLILLVDCATALSFLLENLEKPVIFTGSQIPLSEP